MERGADLSAETLMRKVRTDQTCFGFLVAHSPRAKVGFVL